MPHGQSWFNFLPGYNALEAYMSGRLGQTWLSHGPVAIQHILATLLVILVVWTMGLWARVQASGATDGGLIPGPSFSLRNFFEVVVETIYRQMKSIIGPHAERYLPVIGGLGLFIFFSNILGLVPGFNPPTDNWNTTLACGLFVFFYYNFHGIRTNGFGHIAHMMNPIGTWWGWFLAPLMFPIEIISHFTRPLSLSLRLMGNMIGDHAVLSVFVGMMPLLIPLPFYMLGFVVCVVQTVVFCLLTMVYISLATAHVEH